MREHIDRAREAQQIHIQSHDVQLEIPVTPYKSLIDLFGPHFLVMAFTANDLADSLDLAADMAERRLFNGRALA